jgi:lipoprotein-anchoring transpeptidase ErfK/SrfK
VRRLLSLALVAALSVPAAALSERKPARTCRNGAFVRVGNARLAYAAVVPHRVRASHRPGGRPFVRFGSRNVNRAPTVFGVLGKVVGRSCAASWFRVQLPMRPNGTVGYVRARDVRVEPVLTRLEIDISRRRVTLFVRGRRRIEAPAAVGSRATPTPIGRYYVNQRLIPADPSGPFGPAALGVSAFSNVLTGWVQGGPIGIHGTNEPWSIGHAVSNGCIRLRNAAIRRIFRLTPSGTPVVIHP